MVLLMVQKSHSQPPGTMLKPVVNNGDKLPTSTGERRILAINSRDSEMFFGSCREGRFHPVEKGDDPKF